MAAAATAPAQPEFLTASAAPDTPEDPYAVLDSATLADTLAEAKADWQAVRPSADLSGISADIADLPGQRLGSAAGDILTVDVDAAGQGWDAMDLRTVLRHEIGHALGWSHTPSGLMADDLGSGDSRPVGAEYAQAPIGHAETGSAADHALTAEDRRVRCSTRTMPRRSEHEDLRLPARDAHSAGPADRP